MEKKNLLLKLYNNCFTFLCTEGKIVLVSRTHLQKMQQGKKAVINYLEQTFSLASKGFCLSSYI